MRSPISLGIVFVAMAAFAVAGLHGQRLGPLAIGLVVVLAAAGLLVMTGVRAAYYVGLAAGALTALAGICTWTGLGGARLALPVQPIIAVVVGLYLCFRVAIAHKLFGPRPRPGE